MGKLRDKGTMKKYVIQLILLLLVMLPLMGIPYEKTEEYARKQEILNERATRFRAETGFDGYISYNHNTMKFSTFRGNYQDITVTAPQDTVFMNHVYGQVFAKIRPYISAREGQLSEQKITQSNMKEWIQKVNGYSIHPGGSLRIRYNLPTKEFVIIDNTVDIPNEPIPINISKEEAKQRILSEYYRSEEYKNEAWSVANYNPVIRYFSFQVDGKDMPYQLCWKMGFQFAVYYINVETCELYHHPAKVIH